MTTDQAGNTYAFDAWNRMVSVDGTLLETFSFYANGQRPGQSNCNNISTTSYYSIDWQILEDDSAPIPGCSGPTSQSTYVWGPDYVDDIIERDQSVNGGAVTRIYAEQDANHDVVSLLSTSGSVQERLIYDPYGKPTILTSGWVSTSDSLNWIYRFQGGRYDSFTGLYNFRNRDLNPALGAWVEQDILYIDGANLYRLDRSNPETLRDPSGRGPGPYRPYAPKLPTALPNSVYKMTRELAVFGAGAVHCIDPVTHTFVFTTDDKGKLLHTYSWGNTANTEGWNEDQPEDKTAANDWITAAAPDSLQQGVDPANVDRAYHMLEHRPDQHHKNCFVCRNCKTEANQLLDLARELGKPPPPPPEPPVYRYLDPFPLPLGP